MQNQFVEPTGSKLYQLQRRIVERLEHENDIADYPEYWRMVGSTIQVGYRTGRHCRWRTVPVLSVELLRRYREMEEDALSDIPF